MKNGILLGMLLLASIYAGAQELSALDSAARVLVKENDPQRAVAILNKIILDFRLDKDRDTETLDNLYGSVAMDFVLQQNHAQFENYIGKIRNKFNQTSYLNMAATELLDNHLDTAYAFRIAQRTINLYHTIKADSTARPKDFPRADWDRFMKMAQYPYYDTYARALMAKKRYEEALRYQEKSFWSDVEDGMPGSIERYARLLELNGKKAEAKKILLEMARLGKLNNGMKAQLQSLYMAEKGSDEKLGYFLDSLQQQVQVALMDKLRSAMLDKKAPDFTIRDIDGRTVKLSDYSGRTVVLDLWATWCKPCIASFPAMQTMVKKHPETAFLFIAVEEKEENRLTRIKNFMEEHPYDFNVLIDVPVSPGSQKYQVVSGYQPTGIPAKYIIDKNGILRFSSLGFTTDSELQNELEAMIAITQDL